jgi:hypothetical protein
MKKRVEKKGFVWWGLRIGFGLMILFALIYFRLFYHFIDVGFSTLYSLFTMNLIVISLFSYLLIFTFVMSIIHLKKYKERKFARLAMIIVIFLSIIFFFSLMIVRSL